jgi:hypothetical protein
LVAELCFIHKEADSFPDEVIAIYKLPNASVLTVTSGPAHPLTVISIMNLLGSKAPSALEVDNLNPLCGHNVLKMLGNSASNNSVVIFGLLQR